MSSPAAPYPFEPRGADATSADLRAALSQSDRGTRARLLLAYLEALEGPLELAGDPGTRINLRGIDLSPAVVQASRRERPDGGAAASLTGGVNLRAARLRHVDFAGANLSGADLRGADLSGAVLEQADLSDAWLDGADLEGADLAGANLRGTHFEKARLDRVLCEDCDCRGARLRFASLREAVFESADLRDVDWWSADARGCCLIRADLRGTVLTETDLRGADLSGADLREARLTDCRLDNSRLVDAELAGALVRRCNLDNADLADANCTDVDLTSCRVGHIRLCNAWLEKTRLHLDQLEGAVGEELAHEYERAAFAYSALERNFSGLNDRQAAVWSYLRRRRMQKAWALERARTDWRNHRKTRGVSAFAHYIGDSVTELLCDYGESVPRVLGSLFALFLAFAVIYGVTGSVLRTAPGSSSGEVTYRLTDLALFSFLTMTSGAPSGELAPVNGAAMMLTGVQLFVGVALIGLLGFVLGNRIRR